MRKIALFAVVGSSIGWAVLSTLGGCSSAPTATAVDAGKGKSSSSSSSSSSSGDNSSGSSGSSSSSSSSTSGSPPSDAGKDSSTTTPGGSNPLKITCAATECATDGTETSLQACCWPGGDSTKGVCAAAAGCDPNADFNIACDEKADCKAGVCCFGNGQTLCDADCANVDRPDGQPDMQICKTDAECLTAGQKCTEKTCKTDPAQPDNSVTIKVKVCGTPTNCQ